jgi:hypothetical protein
MVQKIGFLENDALLLSYVYIGDALVSVVSAGLRNVRSVIGAPQHPQALPWSTLVVEYCDFLLGCKLITRLSILNEARRPVILT